MKYPNDPTGNLAAHQHFVAELSKESINLYSISSILGKENRVLGKNKEDYEQIKAEEIRVNGFKVPSFIDCTKMYQIILDDTVDIKRLSNRNITSELSKRIHDRIECKKKEGKHGVYSISVEELKEWNKKVIK
ncbi:MAG: hypothetical protein IJP31_04080 [Lachnospiraceae bacterium]|nr:hypothetical protein [Lachnospiraceae bacterium]